MKNQKAIEIINSPDPGFTESELCVIKWQYRLYGHFYATLFAAIMHADDENLEKLALGFPEEVEGFRIWRGDHGLAKANALAQKIDEVIGL